MIDNWMTLSNDIVYSIRVQDYSQAGIFIRSMLSDIEKIYERIDVSILKEMYTILDSQDMILLADWIEEVWIPYVKSILAEECSNPYEFETCVVEQTSSGRFTLKNKKTNKYYSSNVDPMLEAKLQANLYYDASDSRCVVWGGGLGYIGKAFSDISRGSLSIKMYYDDMNIIEAIKTLDPAGLLKCDNVEIVYDPQAKKFSEEAAKPGMGIFLHFPSIMNMEEGPVKELLSVFFTKWSASKLKKRDMDINFGVNKRNCSKTVDFLLDSFKGATAIVVGGGPSVDRGITYLKKQKGKKLILAASTIVKKLIDNEVTPDYYFVLDPQERTYGHMTNVDTAEIPLIVASTAYWKFAANTNNERYIVYQTGFGLSEKAANKENARLFDTGGSVATLMIDVAVQLGCEQIELLGVDLAFPNNVTHASGTMDYKTIDTANMKKVKAVNGGMVYSDSTFEGYRKWIEEEISHNKGTTFWNLSDSGAEISGAHWIDINNNEVR